MANKLTKEQMAAIKIKEQRQKGLTEFALVSGKSPDELRKSDVIDINTNRDNPIDEFPKKDFRIWVTDMKTHKKVPGSDSIVRSQHYGQAVDDYIIDWNKKKRMNTTIGYPVVQGEKV